jgi:potassium-transporting ATPase KdpC subunit
MKQFLTEFRAALFATLVLAAACCVFYPLAVFGIAQFAFHTQANGSLVTDKQGVIRGSQLLGQSFPGSKYFHSRPSAAGNGYDAANSGGSNLGPTSQTLRDTIKKRIAICRNENGLNERYPLPADAVTASGSGLDPHISPESARLQIARVAATRKLPANAVAVLVEQAVEHPQLGFLGEPRVNVLRLNMALDEFAKEGR